MKVRAIEMGFYANARRRVGDEFDVPEGFARSWFVPVEVIGPAKPKAAKKVDPVALSQLGNQPVKTFVDVMSEKPEV
jgi:hypothetical protein